MWFLSLLSTSVQLLFKAILRSFLLRPRLDDASLLDEELSFSEFKDFVDESVVH